MGRHSDWSVVGLSADPTPGNVWGVRTVATGYQTIATAADTAHTVLSRVKSTGTSTVWAGDAAEVFRDNLGDFPDHVKKCADSFALAATAVSSWASTMDLAQDKADRGLAKAELAQADLEAAQAALASAESLAADAASSLEDKQDLYDLYKNSTPPAGVTVPTSYQLTQLRTQRNGANSGVSTASGDVADAQARLDAAKALVLEALEDYEAGATTLKGSIDNAKDAGVEADSFWEAVFNSEAWAVLIVVLTVVAIVLAVAAFFVTGPLALILAVASVVVGAVMMANDIMAFLNGDMSPLEFAIAIALSVIPGGALAKAAAKALKPLAKAGESIAQGVRTTTKLDNAERPRTVFRNDNRGPNDIFADGFQPHPGHDPSVSLQDYVLSNRPSSFVGASKDPTFYTRWGGSHRYEIQDPGNGVDVNQVLGRTHPYANEFEVAYPGGIPASSIIGARPIKGDGTLGDFITNPGFVSQ